MASQQVDVLPTIKTSGVNFANVFRDDGSSSNTTPLGTIFSYPSFPDLADFSNTSANFSSDGTIITATKSGGTIFSSRLVYNKNSYSSNLEKWKQTGSYNVGSKDGFGLGVGCGDSNAMCALLFLNTLPGRIRLFNCSSGVVLAESNSGDDIVINNGDIIQFTLQDDKGTFTATFQNITTPGLVSVSYTYPLVYPITQTQPVSFGPALYAIGGTQTVINWFYESAALVGAKYMFCGDSITAGFFANTESNRWSDLAAGLNSYNVYAGPGCKTDSFYLPEMIALRPQILNILLGVNDQITSVPIVTAMANLQTMVTAMATVTSVINVFQITPLDTIDNTAFNAAVVSNFGVNADFFTLLKGIGTGYAIGKSPDGIHPGSPEQLQMAMAAAPFL